MNRRIICQLLFNVTTGIVIAVAILWVVSAFYAIYCSHPDGATRDDAFAWRMRIAGGTIVITDSWSGHVIRGVDEKPSIIRIHKNRYGSFTNDIKALFDFKYVATNWGFVLPKADYDAGPLGSKTVIIIPLWVVMVILVGLALVLRRIGRA